MMTFFLGFFFFDFFTYTISGSSSLLLSSFIIIFFLGFGVFGLVLAVFTITSGSTESSSLSALSDQKDGRTTETEFVLMIQN
jgi:hypothetical protein